jgi:DNA-binding NtrC family response regulator
MATRPSALGADRRAPSRRLNGTILVVDDDRIALQAIVRCLRHSEYRVLTASEPEVALAILSRETVDVIITALHMSSMNGLEFLDRARERRPEAIRIVVTGHPSAASAIAAINENEVFRYLTKPVSEERLLPLLQLAFARLSTKGAPQQGTAGREARVCRRAFHPAQILTLEERLALREALKDFGGHSSERSPPLSSSAPEPPSRR